MGGELVHEIPGFVEYRIEDIIALKPSKDERRFFSKT
jgi:hypothetical protein